MDGSIRVVNWMRLMDSQVYFDWSIYLPREKLFSIIEKKVNVLYVHEKCFHSNLFIH